jgi:hypothetical protein
VLTTSAPPGLNTLMHLRYGHPLVLVVEAVEHVEGCDQVEARSRERDTRDVSLDDTLAVRLSRERDPRPGQVEPVGVAERFKQVEIRSGAATAVEHAGAGKALNRLLQEGTDEAAEAPEPEMPLLRPKGCPVAGDPRARS